MEAVTETRDAQSPAQVRVEAEGLTIEYPLAFGRGLWSRQGRRTYLAVDGVSFTLTPGQRLGLLGRNGSGKSTLLKAVAGVYPPSKGRLQVDGSVAAVFNASLGFVKHATGLENIFLRGALLGLDFEEIKALLPGIIEFSELGDWIDRPISEYSSGMALRLAFSITTAIRSDILLLDEWLGAGDAGFLEKARRRMAEMVEDASIMIFATHNMGLMRSQCNTGLVLEGGRVEYMGEIEPAIEVYENLRRTKIQK